MRYTQSPETIDHPATGGRLHTDTAPIPSVVSADDINMMMWELNALRIAAGLAGVAFNPNDPSTYTQVLQALNQLFITPSELAAYAPSASDTQQGLLELATSSEGILGASASLAVSPFVLAAVLAAKVASESVAGLARFATSAQAIAGSSNSLAVHPAGLAAVLANVVNARPGHTYTASDWVWVDKQAGLFLNYGKVAVPGVSGVTWTYANSFTTGVLAAWGTPNFAVAQPTIFNGLPGLSSAVVDYKDPSEAGDSWVFALGK